jgi:deoxyribose-phosphate aldolase
MRELPPWLAPHARLGALIDHTLLRPEATETEILRLAEEAKRLGLGAVCINGQWVPTVAHALAGSGVRLAAVAGFPLGASGSTAKVGETLALINDGADEIDVVMALGWAKAGAWAMVREEIGAVVQAAAGRLVKVILETGVLTGKEIERACLESLAAGAGMVKTSTGFHPSGGATVDAVRLMREVVGDRAGVKASGGIRTLDDARRMLLAGADRLGTSSAAGWGRVLDRRLDEDLAGHDLG